MILSIILGSVYYITNVLRFPGKKIPTLQMDTSKARCNMCLTADRVQMTLVDNNKPVSLLSEPYNNSSGSLYSTTNDVTFESISGRYSFSHRQCHLS